MNWKELQQMAKEFDREARKERQGAGEHRADAVGLLTPALLRKHIKSGTDLVLAYGKKGATVSYTVDDLKRFVEARERADKAFPAGTPGRAAGPTGKRVTGSRPPAFTGSEIRPALQGERKYAVLPGAGEYQPPLPCPRTP